MSDTSSLESLLAGIQAKGNGFVVGTVAEDGRVVPFALLRVRLWPPRDSRPTDRHRPQR